MAQADEEKTINKQGDASVIAVTAVKTVFCVLFKSRAETPTMPWSQPTSNSSSETGSSSTILFSLGVISLQKVFKLFALGRVAQLAQSLCLYLTDTLSRDVEFSAHLLKRARPAVVYAVAQTQHHFLAGSELVQHADKLLL